MPTTVHSLNREMPGQPLVELPLDALYLTEGTAPRAYMLASEFDKTAQQRNARPVEFDRIRALLVRYADRLQDKNEEPPGQFLIAHALLQAVELINLMALSSQKQPPPIADGRYARTK